ncbi:hypothetical protein [Plebeiibacterium sediminum]|uniref:Uncharacterized protein n=1 Tax=Plebeiibacterium sediminum TaxID=2992112 RepID=A0AAE3MAQ4_9BACT|nr:hypothetical protein [Plebeiobacterium sediminum]MCW3789565.1 hypothetical protein [Plebeiobacterium sediminum]
MKYIYPILFLLLVVLAGCSDDDLYLEESVFIEDPEVPGLPIYSEYGYNTFGVRYDRDVITNNTADYPLKVIVSDGSCSFNFNGRKDYYNDFNITLKLDNYLPNDEYDLLDLNNQVIDLTGEQVDVEIEDNGKEESVEILNGQFTFKKVQRLTVDEVESGVILSGVFDFKAIINGEPVAFSYGRFDVIISYSNFFVLN